MITKYITRNRVNSNWKNGEKVLNYSNSLTNTEDIWYKPNRWNDSSIQTVDKLGAGHNPQHQVCLQSETIFDGLKNCFDKSKFRHFLSKINVFRFFLFWILLCSLFMLLAVASNVLFARTFAFPLLKYLRNCISCFKSPKEFWKAARRFRKSKLLKLKSGWERYI